MSIFKIEEFDIQQKKRDLKVKSSGKVSSVKCFPIFEINKKEVIFKPLSKSKPLSTPLFSYSEVYWSYLLKKYIDESTPLYSLANCKGLSKYEPKYYEKGTIVENVLSDGENLINLLQFFQKYPTTSVNINDYTNYCEVQYDYSSILQSSFFTENKELGEQLANQILCSILRRDDNYHYENANLIEKNGKIVRVAPMIDLEFSEMFMYKDLEKKHRERFSLYDEGMCPIFKYNPNLSYEENYDIFNKKIEEGSIYDYYDNYHFANLMKNIKTIVQLYPDVAKKFLEKIEKMKKEVEELDITFNASFLGKISSYDWKLGYAIYKENESTSSQTYLKLKEEVEKSRVNLDKEKFNITLKQEVLWSIEKLSTVLNLFLERKENKFLKIDEYENKTLYGSVRRIPEEALIILAKREKLKIKSK